MWTVTLTPCATSCAAPAPTKSATPTAERSGSLSFNDAHNGAPPKHTRNPARQQSINPDYTTWLSEVENATAATGDKGIRHTRRWLRSYETDTVARSACFRTRPISNGGFHIEVDVTGDSTGAYWIRVTRDPLLLTWNGTEIVADDLPHYTSTWAELSVGSDAEGRYGFGGDEDWHELDLTAGTVYTFTVANQPRKHSGIADQQDTAIYLVSSDGSTTRADIHQRCETVALAHTVADTGGGTYCLRVTYGELIPDQLAYAPSYGWTYLLSMTASS